MRNLLISLGFLVVLFGGTESIEVKAQSAGTCTTWGCNAYVESLEIHSDGILWIATTADESLANCTALAGTHFLLDARVTSNIAFDAVYSTLLTAQAQNKKVIIRITEGVTDCPVIYVKYSNED